jgi:membrane-bound lytic murein transglycosylase B
MLALFPRIRRAAPLLVVLGALLSPTSSGSSTGSKADFPLWMAKLEDEARQRGISAETLEMTLGDLEPDPRVLELDRRQPGAPGEFCGYLERRLTPTRVARGRRILEEHGALLEQIRQEFGVPPRYLVALWGLETNFGDYTGSYPVIGSLVTLAYDPRRSDLFREQIFAALRIVDEGHYEGKQMLGSWAGASGQVQLMPTTFLEYAVDHDGDGRKDVWTSLPDALASAANYLKRSGWRSGETWGRPVRVPAEIGVRGARRTPSRTLAHWRNRGVTRADGGALPIADLRGALVFPARKLEPAFLVYRNYRTFLTWNQSTFFAISVGALADEISGVGSLQLCDS